MSLPIPQGALAQHIAVLGKTGSGKSYAIRGVVERLLDAEARCCVIDPTGTWWGLKSSATGKSAGYPVVIFGGTHADLPLGAAHGEALAEAIGTSSTPAILDTSQMKVGERTRFFADFADALVRKNKGPLHLVIDEAHLFAPQGKVNDPQSGAMLHAANNLVSLGRSRGLRIVLITQRPAKLHKDSLTQVETLVAMRLIAPQDRKAVEEWIKDNADQDKGREVISSLATLKTGQAWVWAPELGVLERVVFPRICTFDSSKAPDEAGEGAGPVLAPINREAIAARLKAVAVETEANDPKKLRAQIAELQRELAHKPRQSVDPAALEQAERRGFERGVAGAHEAQRALLASLRHKLMGTFANLEAQVGTLIDDAQPVEPKPSPATIARAACLPTKVMFPEPKAGRDYELAKRHANRIAGNGASDSTIGTGGKRRIMVALAQQGRQTDQRRLSLLTGLSARSGTWSTYLSELRQAGYIEGRDQLTVTAAGLEALGSFEPLPTGHELVDYWRRRLGGSGKRAIFDAIVDAYPNGIDQEAVATAANMSSRSGTWSTYLSELRGLGLIEGRAELRACEELFA